MLGLWRELGDEEGIARGLSDLGTVAAAVGDYDEAVSLLEQSAEGFRALGQLKRLGVVLANLGHVAAQRGDYATAISVTEEALGMEQGRGKHQPNEAISLYNLGSYAFESGDHAGARAWLGECLTLTHELGYKEVMAYALATFVRLLLAEDNVRLSAKIAGVADRLLADAGVPLQTSEQAKFDAAKAAARDALGTDAFEHAHAAGFATPPDAALAELGVL
jgi:tetratricopeptide (TPR) repeat protein